jgi:hypothetical protein
VDSIFQNYSYLYHGLKLHLPIELAQPDSVRVRGMPSLNFVIKYFVISWENDSDANITSRNLEGFHHAPLGA